MEKKCRIWWPKQLSLAKPSSAFTFLFGWPVSCSPASVDVVVAFACDKASLRHSQSTVMEVIRETNAAMPVSLQEKSKFCLLGRWVECVSSNGERLEASKNRNVIGESYDGWRCGCCDFDGLVEKYWPISVESGLWIQLVYEEFCEGYDKAINWIPTLQHFHWGGQVVSHCDVNVIIYEIPLYGVHHFSLNSVVASKKIKDSTKSPNWVHELHKNQPLLDLDTVILAINCAAAAIRPFERLMEPHRSVTISSIICKCFTFIWRVFAFFVASISTIFYIILQSFHQFSSFLSEIRMYSALTGLFQYMGINIHIRCSQILYWPMFLQDSSLRLDSCVEYAEKAALHRHSMWSSLVVDLVLGNLFGLALLCHSENANLCIMTFASDSTNELLRSGCVWLMGVPAGFKLNTELARVLGIVSLNAIQIWSTLLVFISFSLNYFIKGLALLGILFGVTIPASLVIDTIFFSTLHVTTLHWAISILYSWQIQALAALWRLFRGRKWNPLRQRLDSYDYSVKQHVVGSLLFTPLLLLLPTISVFYIFFTILTMTVSLLCVFIEVTISIVHGTPYVKIFLWLVRKRRFPSGIWFEILSCQNDSLASASLGNVSSSSKNSQQMKDRGYKRSSIMISILQSNFLEIGQVTFPHYKRIFSGISDFLSSSASGALTGKRTPCTLQTCLPSALPWMSIPSKEYWLLCYNSMLACMIELEVQEYR